MIRRILLASDGSASSLAAAHWVRELCENIPGAMVTVLNVQQNLTPAFAAEYAPALPPHVFEDESRRILEITADALALDPARVTSEFQFGSPADVIVKKAVDYDLVVVGSRGLNPMAQIVMGSVSDRVARHAARPVVIVRP